MHLCISYDFSNGGYGIYPQKGSIVNLFVYCNFYYSYLLSQVTNRWYLVVIYR